MTSRRCAASAASRAAGVRVRGDARRQAADAAEQRGRHRRGHQVERADGRVDDRGPVGQVRGAGRAPFRLGRVVLVVAGEVELAEVVHRVAPVQLKVRVDDPLQVLERPQVRLVVRVARAPGGPARAAASRASPAATPSCDRSCGTPSYSCLPPYSRASATFRSQIARTRGSSSSMDQNATRAARQPLPSRPSAPRPVPPIRPARPPSPHRVDRPSDNIAGRLGSTPVYPDDRTISAMAEMRPHPLRITARSAERSPCGRACCWMMRKPSTDGAAQMTEIPEFTTRPELAGTFGMVASTHWLASAAGMAVLEQGGNAFDAAAAAGFTLQVVEPHLNGPGGEVPVIGHDARRGETFVVCGQGTAPAAATAEAYTALGLDLVPGSGLLAATVPGAFGGWLLLLREYGTLRLRDVLGYAIGYAAGRLPAGPRDQLVDRQRRRPVPRALAHLGGGLPAGRRRARAGHPVRQPRARRHLRARSRRGGGGERRPRRAARGRPPRLVRRLRRRGDRQVRHHRGDGRDRGAAPRPAHRPRPVHLARPPRGARQRTTTTG